jgi:hypothetical protein
VLEALEASIAKHPASGRREQHRPDSSRTVTATPASEGATVLRLVPRRHTDTPHTPDAA